NLPLIFHLTFFVLEPAGGCCLGVGPAIGASTLLPIGALSVQGRLPTVLPALQTQRLFGASLVTSLSLHTFSHFPKVLLSGVSMRSQFLPALSCPFGLSKANAAGDDCNEIKIAAHTNPALRTANKVFKLLAFIVFS